MPLDDATRTAVGSVMELADRFRLQAREASETAYASAFLRAALDLEVLSRQLANAQAESKQELQQQKTIALARSRVA